MEWLITLSPSPSMGENTHVHMDQMVEVYPCICCQLPLTLHCLYVVQIGTLMYLIFADPF